MTYIKSISNLLYIFNLFINSLYLNTFIIGVSKMEDNIYIECKASIDNKKYSWKAILKSFINHNDYYEAVIEARGSSIHLLVGRSDSFNWLALPFLDVSTTLSSFDDIFWNEEKLSLLIK